MKGYGHIIDDINSTLIFNDMTWKTTPFRIFLPINPFNDDLTYISLKFKTKLWPPGNFPTNGVALLLNVTSSWSDIDSAAPPMRIAPTGHDILATICTLVFKLSDDEPLTLSYYLIDCFMDNKFYCKMISDQWIRLCLHDNRVE